MRTDPHEFLAVLAPAVRQAASIARALEGRVQNRPKWGEESAAKAALTIADSAAQEAILVPLREHFGTVALHAEEDTPSVSGFPKQSDECVVVDPIDGTLRFYLHGEGPYAVMVGLARERRYEAALVALPREGLFFEATRGGAARMARAGGGPRQVRAEADGARACSSPRACPRPCSSSCAPKVSSLRRRAAARSRSRRSCPAYARAFARRREGRASAGRAASALLISGAGGAQAETERGEPFPAAIDAPARILLVTAREEERKVLRRAAALLEADPQG